MSDLKMLDITSGLANKIRAITLPFFKIKFKVKKKKKRKKKKKTKQHLSQNTSLLDSFRRSKRAEKRLPLPYGWTLHPGSLW